MISYITDEELTDGLDVDINRHWTEWGWKKTGGWDTLEFARMEDYRNRVSLAYHLYDRISFEHLRREISGLSPESAILDAGGGTAGQSIPLAALGYKNITLLDISGKWLKWAAVKIAKAGFDKEIRLIHGNIKNMNMISDNSFDFSFALGGVISYCRGAKDALKELYRVTGPGGKILFNAHNTLYEKVLQMKSGNYKATEEKSKQKKSKEEKAGICIESFDPDELVNIAEESGFTNVKLMAEYFFVPDDDIIRTEETKEREEAIVRAEMECCGDRRFLGGGMIIVSGEKHTRGQ